MSLFDYLNSDSTSAASSSSAASQISQLLQQVQAQQGIVVPANTKTTSESTNSGGQSNVLITVDAQRASATAADAKKDATALAAEIRKALDEQYHGKTNQTPNMTAFSGRALAIVALNDDGRFSKAEVAAAKAELRERDRASALTFLNSGDVTAASLRTYSQQLLAARNTMSKEEQALRDIDPNFR